MSYNIGFIGGGNMSTAIAKGILRNDIYTQSKMWVSGPHLSSLKHWEELGAQVTTKNGELFGKCQIIFLGVKPNMLNDAVADIKRTLPPNVACENIVFVSMLAGITIDQLHTALQVVPNGTEVHVVRIMPNMPMGVGAGACLYTPDSRTTSDECKIIEELLGSCGICEQVPEKLMNVGGALPGCGPAFMYMAAEALADGAVKQGMPRAMAIRLAAQVLIGSGQMILKTNKHPGLLKDEVCSPGGSTICGVAALEKGGLRAALIDAIEEASRRTMQLGQLMVNNVPTKNP